MQLQMKKKIRTQNIKPLFYDGDDDVAMRKNSPDVNKFCIFLYKSI